MRKLIALCLSLTLATFAAPAQADEAPLKVVASFSILGDMVKNVAGARADVTVIVGPDSDAHSFEPGPGHASALAEADLLVINGLGFEPWLVRLASAARSKATYVVASYGVPARPRAEGAHAHQHEEDGEEENHPPTAGGDFDPHAWQNLRNGIIYVRNIADALAKKDPANATLYEANAESYIAELSRLDEWVRVEIGRLPQEKRKVITTHDAFGYFGAAYGVTFIAPAGIANDAEPSAQALAGLIDQIRREKIRALFMENMTSPRMMEVIARETGAEEGGTLYSDALSAPGSPAPTYTAMFRHNVPALMSAMQKN
jgi:zinc/manganese transport system substrate-binding protein